MTTPEAFRRRQRIEGTALLILGVFTVLVSLYFRHQDASQRECFGTYTTAQARTAQVRARVVDLESHTTRNFLLNATDPTKVKTAAQFQAVRLRYVRALHEVDAVRKANPIRSFKPGSCTD